MSKTTTALNEKTTVSLFNVIAAVFVLFVTMCPALFWIGKVDAKTIEIETRVNKHRETLLKNDDDTRTLLDRTARMEVKIDMILNDTLKKSK